MIQDLRYALRGLRRAPAFTAAAVITLAIAISVNTIVFTLINALAFRPMPVRDAVRTVRVYPVDDVGHRGNLFSYPDFVDLTARADGFEGLAAYIPVAVTAADGDRPREALAYTVSASYFPLLGIPLSLGRSFTVGEENDPGSGRVVIISHTLWSRRFGAADGALGRTVTLNGQAFTIVGVGPSRFMGTEPLDPDFWVPLSAQPIVEPGGNRLADRTFQWLLVVGRLRSGVTAGVAEERLSAVMARLGRLASGARRTAAVALAPGTFFTAGPELRPVLRLALGAVAMLLVIACANISNLTLTRASGRRRDITVRLALGASRARLGRHLLAESLVISMLGGIAGLLLSAWTLRALYPVALSLLPFRWTTVVLDLAPDGRVFGYTLALSLAAGLLFGVAPLLQMSAQTLAAGLRDQTAWFGGQVRGSRMRQGLVVLQISACLMLLAGAALAARALQRTESLDLGFSVEGVVHASTDLERHGYSGPAAAALYSRLTERVRSLPGVTSVALTSHVPLTGGVRRTTASLAGSGTNTRTDCTYTAVSPGYFRTLGIPIIAGRDFTDSEAHTGEPSAVISEALARRFWPGSSALGRRVTVPQSGAPLTIVGVARDATDVSPWRENEISLYVPAKPSTAVNLDLLVRGSVHPRLVIDALERETAAHDPTLRLEAAPLADVLRLWILPSRVAAVSATVLGAIALAMAAIGIYGVMAYAVSQRTRELGIRIALGASRADIRHLVIRDAARVVAAGMALGLCGAAVMVRLVSAVLPGARALDPIPFAAAVAVLGAVAFAASYLPARAASAVDPLAALRVD